MCRGPKAAPHAELIVYANEALWTNRQSRANLGRLRRVPVSPWSSNNHSRAAGKYDTVWRRISGPLAVLRPTESCMTAPLLERSSGRYDSINIKLDKTAADGALAMADAAHRLSPFDIMIGLHGRNVSGNGAGQCCWRRGGALCVDLERPLLLARDRDGGCLRDGRRGYPPEAARTLGLGRAVSALAHKSSAHRYRPPSPRHQYYTPSPYASYKRPVADRTRTADDAGEPRDNPGRVAITMSGT